MSQKPVLPSMSSPSKAGPSSGSEDYGSCSEGCSEASPEHPTNGPAASPTHEDISLRIRPSVSDMQVVSETQRTSIVSPPKGFQSFIRKTSQKFLSKNHRVERNASCRVSLPEPHTRHDDTPDNGYHYTQKSHATDESVTCAKLSFSAHPTSSQKPIEIPRSLSFNAKGSHYIRRASDSLSISAGNSRQPSPSPKTTDMRVPGSITSAVNTSLDAASQTASQSRGFVKNLTSNISRQLSFKNRGSRVKTSPELNGIPADSQGPICYKEMLKLFECPGCLLLMNPPFYQCRKGHLVCDKCKVALKVTCPKCKQRITEETNAMMQEVCHLISFPCRFGKYGCGEFYRPRQKADHENFCAYRPVHCHFSSHGCQKVLTLRDMKIHVDECQYKIG